MDYGHFLCVSCPLSEKPVESPIKALSEQNRTRGRGQVQEHFPSWRKWLRPLGLPLSTVAAAGRALDYESRDLESSLVHVALSQSCSLSATVSNLETEGCELNRHFQIKKHAVDLRVGRLVSWTQLTGPAGEGSQFGVTLCPPFGLLLHCLLPQGLLKPAPTASS